MRLYCLATVFAVVQSFWLLPQALHPSVLQVIPSKRQVNAAISRAVCGSFNRITYSGKDDSPLTIRQIREFNAAWRSYGCRP
jgi:hypothetical protein